jgi:prepilin peptidase CpaA
MIETRIGASLLVLASLASCLILLALARQDLRQRRLPNKQVAAVGVLYLLAAPGMASPLLPHLALGLFTLLLSMLLTARGVLGGGDAKLAVVILTWAGPRAVFPTLFWITQAGLLLALLGLLAQKWLQHQPPRWTRSSLRCLTAKRGVPYGVALACGGIFAIATQLN